MTTEINYKTTVNAQFDSVWTTLKTFDGVERYLPIVNSSYIETENYTTKRVCDVQIEPGKTVKLVEKLDFVDETKHSLGYTIIEAPEPFKNAIGIITVRQSADNQCEIEFSGKFMGKSNPEIKKMAESIYSMMAEGLRKLHES